MAANNNSRFIKQKKGSQDLDSSNAAKGESNALVSMLRSLLPAFSVDHDEKIHEASARKDCTSRDGERKKLIELVKNKEETFIQMGVGGKVDQDKSLESVVKDRTPSTSFNFEDKNGDLCCPACDWHPSKATFDEFLKHCNSKEHLNTLKTRFLNSSNETVKVSVKPIPPSKVGEFLDVNKGPVTSQPNYEKSLSGCAKGKKQEVQKNKTEAVPKKPQVNKATQENQKKADKEKNDLGIPLELSLSYTRFVNKNWMCTLCNKPINFGYDFLTLMRNANSHYNGMTHKTKISVIQAAANILSGREGLPSRPLAGNQDIDAMDYFKNFKAMK